MPDTPDHEAYYTLADRIEAVAELASEMPEVADWHNNYQGTVEMVGIDGAALSVVERLALSHIAGAPYDVVHGVWDLIAAARQVGYEEGHRDGVADALADLEEDDEDYGPLPL